MSVATNPAHPRELRSERIALFTADEVPVRHIIGGGRFTVFCPYCGSDHEHGAPMRSLHDLRRVPPCEAGAAVPRAYLIRRFPRGRPPVVDNPDPPLPSPKQGAAFFEDMF